MVHKTARQVCHGFNGPNSWPISARLLLYNKHVHQSEMLFALRFHIKHANAECFETDLAWLWPFIPWALVSYSWNILQGIAHLSTQSWILWYKPHAGLRGTIPQTGHERHNKLRPSLRRHFQMHIIEWKCIKFTEKGFHWNGSNWQYASIGSDNGLAPTRRQAIMLTNAGLFTGAYICLTPQN